MTETPPDNPFEDRVLRRIPLDSLLLDKNNPRFGFKDPEAGQAQILDRIVEKFGVDDVLSSLAVNGYFEAEPIVCRQQGDSDRFIVVEGNRRLAACLMIAQDHRAMNQASRGKEFQDLWKENGSPSIEPVPAIVFEESEQDKTILSFLGVRHIASSQPWDSYAKAAWVAHVVEAGELEIEEVAKMIGDRHKTVSRLLEGYYLVEQLVREDEFVPEDSIRKGRGSVTQYPFSWVYTILGYKNVRKFLAIGEASAHRDPLTKSSLENGGILLRAMFGDRSIGRNAAVEDSRKLRMLADALGSAEKLLLIQAGKTVDEIEVLTQPVEQRLAQGLGSIRDTLRDLIARLHEKDVDQETAENLVPVSTKNKRMAISLDSELKQIARNTDGED